MISNKNLLSVIIFIMITGAQMHATPTPSFSARAGGGWNMERYHRNFYAMGPSFDAVLTAGGDFGKFFSLFGEMNTSFSGVTVNKSTFINAPNSLEYGLGVGMRFYCRGFSLSLSSGLFALRYGRAVSHADAGLYLSAVTRVAIYASKMVGDFYVYSLYFPVSCYWAGETVQVRAGIAVGVDITAFGTRTSKEAEHELWK